MCVSVCVKGGCALGTLESSIFPIEPGIQLLIQLNLDPSLPCPPQEDLSGRWDEIMSVKRLAVLEVKTLLKRRAMHLWPHPGSWGGTPGSTPAHLPSLRVCTESEHTGCSSLGANDLLIPKQVWFSLTPDYLNSHSCFSISWRDCDLVLGWFGATACVWRLFFH